MTVNNIVKSLFVLFIIVSCETYDNSQIIYEELDDIQFELIREIGDEHIFGRLDEIEVFSDGSFLAKDGQRIIIEQFDNDGSYIGAVAEEGRGPGELPSSSFSLIGLNNDSLIIHNTSSFDLKYFTRNSDDLFVFNEMINPGQTKRPINILGPNKKNRFWAQVSMTLNLQSRQNPKYREVPIVVVDAEQNIVADSVFMLKRPRSDFIITDNGFPIGAYGFRDIDQFKVLDNGNAMIARADSSLLNFYDNDKKLIKSIFLNIKPRPVTEEDIELLLEGLPENWHEPIRSHIPETKPPFENISVSEDKIWLHAGNYDGSKLLVVLTMEGKSLGKILLPLEASVQKIQDDIIYTIHKDEEQGDQIRIYRTDL